MTHKETRNIKFEKKNKDEDGASNRPRKKIYIYISLSLYGHTYILAAV